MDQEEKTNLCRVCGDKAKGYHYMVLSCMPCKTFFRNNALKSLKNCAFNGKCRIDNLTRKSCKHCRLKKCLEVGMKKELVLFRRPNKEIQSSEQDKIKTEMIETGTTICPCDSTTTDEMLKDFSENKFIKCQKITDEFEKIENFISNTELNSTSDSFCRISLTPIVRPITDYRNNFNELEGFRLTELLFATNIFKISPIVGHVKESQDYWEACALSTPRNDYEIKNIAEMCKLLKGFKEICADDQLVLLKYCVMEILIIRTIDNLDYENQIWKFTHDGFSWNIKLDLMKKDAYEQYEMIKGFFDIVVPELDSDPVTLNLLTGIMVFNPNVPDLNFKDVVKFQQQIYMYLLQRYLQLRYRCDIKAKSKFLSLMDGLKYLYKMRKGTDQVYSNLEKRKIYKSKTSPLIHEILDL